MLPVVPALLGSHPLALELISGSTLAEVTIGARSSLGELPVWVAVAAGVPASMMFDWVYWWAGRRWGHRAVHLMLGSRRPGRAEKIERRIDRFGGRFGGLEKFDYEAAGALRFINWTGEIEDDSTTLMVERRVSLVRLVARGRLTQIGGDHSIACGSGYMTAVCPEGVC